MRELGQLPHARVAVAPQVAHAVGELGQEARGARIEHVPGIRVGPADREEVAVDAELQLVAGRVARDDGADPGPSGRVEELHALHRLAPEGVHDAQVAVGADGLHHPRQRGVGLLAQAEAHERVRRVGEVAHPGEAVVPVLPARGILRQRRRRRGGDGARRGVDEEFQGEGAALHGILPRSVVGELLRPVAPARDRAVERSRLAPMRPGSARCSGSSSFAMIARMCVESAAVVNVPRTAERREEVASARGRPTSEPMTASIVEPTCSRCTPSCFLIHGAAVRRRVPGRTAQRNRTSPRMPAIRRTSCAHGNRPATPVDAPVRGDQRDRPAVADRRVRAEVFSTRDRHRGLARTARRRAALM